MPNPTILSKRLTHLAQMIQNMEPVQAKLILSDLENDIKFSRKAIHFLGRKLLTPSVIFDELANDELAYILKPLEMKTLNRIIKDLNENNKRRCAEILGKVRFKDALYSERCDALSSTIDKLIQGLSKGVSAGKIAYNGIALFLVTPPCRPPGKRLPKKKCVFFQTLNPIVSPGEGIRIVIYAPNHPNILARVSLQSTGKRFFDKNAWFSPVKLDDSGFFLGDIFPKEEPGPATVWLEIPEGGEVCRTVLFAQPARAVFTPDLISIVDKLGTNKRKSITFQLNGIEETKNDRVRVILYCSRCGVPISSGYVQLDNFRGCFEFIDPCGENAHYHDYYLHIVAGKHQSGIIINIHSWKKIIIPLSEEQGRTAGNDHDR